MVADCSDLGPLVLLTGPEAECSALAYGRSLRSLWQIDPETRFINHGAFGATPLIVAEEQTRWRTRVERNTARFFMNDLPGLLRDTAEAVAPFVGTEPDRVAFTENASSATGAVLRSLDFRPGDEILTTDHVYGAVRNNISYICHRTGAVAVEAAIPLPVIDANAAIAAIEERLTEKTKLIVIDHVTSASALEFPIKGIVELCRGRGVPVLIDGAHAPGMLELNIDAIGADWYVANCHKWLCAPKGAAFIVVADRPVLPIHPLVISHAYGRGFTAEFDKVGTRDPSSWLCIPAAIDFHESLGGAALRSRNRAMAAKIAVSLCDEAGLSLAGHLELSHSMISLVIPGAGPATREECTRIHDVLYDRYGFEAAITAVCGTVCLRLSVHAYNDESDYAGLGAALLDAIAPASVGGLRR